MLEQGRIVAVDADAVWVDTDRQTTCGSCSAQKACGTRLLNALHPSRDDYLRLVVDKSLLAELRTGDRVEISIPDEVVVQASAVVYLLPLALLLAGAVLGNQLLPGDAGTALGGILGFLSGALLVRLHAVANRGNRRLQPSLVRRLAGPGVELQAAAPIL